MSAWIVSKAHIDAMVQSMIEHGLIDMSEATTVGRELWEENRRSVADRYPADRSGTRPGPIGLTDEAMAAYVFEGVEARLDPEGIHYACDCYAYQSCEHPGWGDSPSAWRIQRLREALRAQPIDINPPYGRWPWGIDDIHQVILREAS